MNATSQLFESLWGYVASSPIPVEAISTRYTLPDDLDFHRLHEAMTHKETRIPPDDSQEERNINSMIESLLKLEEHLGVKISLTSGYRPEPINSEVGGVPGSEHTKGNAADCYSEDMDDMEFESSASKYWLDNKLGGVGYGMAARGFVHLDLAEVREWDY